MKIFAEIQNDLIINISVWDVEIPQGHRFVEITGVENVGIGWSYINGKFIEPAQPELKSESESESESALTE